MKHCKSDGLSHRVIMLICHGYLSTKGVHPLVFIPGVVINRCLLVLLAVDCHHLIIWISLIHRLFWLKKVTSATRVRVGWGASQPPTPSLWVMFLDDPGPQKDDDMMECWDMAMATLFCGDLGVMIFACWLQDVWIIFHCFIQVSLFSKMGCYLMHFLCSRVWKPPKTLAFHQNCKRKIQAVSAAWTPHRLFCWRSWMVSVYVLCITND